VLVALVDAFGGAGVSIPFPQLDVTLRKAASGPARTGAMIQVEVEGTDLVE